MNRNTWSAEVFVDTHHDECHHNVAADVIADEDHYFGVSLLGCSVVYTPAVIDGESCSAYVLVEDDVIEGQNIPQNHEIYHLIVVGGKGRNSYVKFASTDDETIATMLSASLELRNAIHTAFQNPIQ